MTEFKHVRCVSTAGNIHGTIVKNTYPNETKVKSTHSVFAFMLSGCEPFTIHSINLRYIIYKAAMLIHSQNSKTQHARIYISMTLQNVGNLIPQK